MNEEKILELILSLVGGDKGFEKMGEMMGKAVNTSYHTTNRAAGKVVGGVKAASVAGMEQARSAVDSFNKGFHGYEDNGPAYDRKNELDRQVQSLLDDYDCNRGERKFIAERIGVIAEEARTAMLAETNPKLARKAGVETVDHAIRSYRQDYGALQALSSKGMDALDDYFKGDVVTKESFIGKYDMKEAYDRFLQAKAAGDERKLKESETALREKATGMGRGWERSTGEQETLRQHFKRKM